MSAEHALVTGAGGYIGRHVVTALLDVGFSVTAVLRPGSGAVVDERAQIAHADILDPAFDPTSLASAPPTAVVHLAWQDGFAHNAPSHMLMLSAHYGFLSKVVEWGVPRVSVLGTMHEIGYWEGAIDQDTPTNPSTLYGIAKDALRKAVFTSLSDKTALSWLRCYYIYGDDRNNNSIFTRLLEAVDAGKSTFPFTTGKNQYDFIKVDELGRQIAAVAAQDEVRGIINCSTGVPISLADTVEAFISENQLPISLDYGRFPDRPYDSPGVWGDATIIRRLTAS
jgi:nucleoside-diphosphate-sugar epimerase